MDFVAYAAPVVETGITLTPEVKEKWNSNGEDFFKVEIIITNTSGKHFAHRFYNLGIEIPQSRDRDSAIQENLQKDKESLQTGRKI